MTTATVRRIDTLRDAIAPFLSFFNGPFAKLNANPEIANFAVGNPHDMPMPEYVAALGAHLEPHRSDWFAYKGSEPKSRLTVARSLSARTGMQWDPDDVAMTNGGFAALAVALGALVEPGDEVIFLSPPWFFYEFMILAAGGVPVRLRLAPPAFEPDLDELAAAITSRTRAVIFNTPHNPSGRVYPLETLNGLAETLSDALAVIGHPVFLISDEPYNRIIFDGREFHSPAEVYPYTLVSYSYGKTLLAPGQRIGYLTWPPEMPGREAIREMVMVAQMATGYAFPNALLQHAIEDLEGISIDVAAMQRRRDRIVHALRQIGYETTNPEGTFYIMARAPIADDVAFADILAKHRVLVLPGTVVEVPGWFRISLTATDEMVARGIDGFAAAYAEASAMHEAK
ncbi:MAG: aminotransferase class I/II-fold pyridoxal phosphate-dependent enzyme [Chloroflexota bacterium]